MRRMFMWGVLLGVLSMTVHANQGCEGSSCDMMFGSAADSDQPIVLRVEVASASVTNGVTLRVEIENKGAPMSLSVCPAMKLCCVKGLHPLIGYGKTGMGLLDVCKVKKPTPHETFLPTGASFCFPVTITPDYLEGVVAGTDKTVRVQFCYELGEDDLVHSNTVEAELK